MIYTREQIERTAKQLVEDQCPRAAEVVRQLLKGNDDQAARLAQLDAQVLVASRAVPAGWKLVPVDGSDDLPVGPWTYRSREFDDWGIVRDADGYVVCQARDTRALDDETIAAHRKAGTDPWVKVARFIVDARNAMLAAAPDLKEGGQ